MCLAIFIKMYVIFTKKNLKKEEYVHAIFSVQRVPAPSKLLFIQ